MTSAAPVNTNPCVEYSQRINEEYTADAVSEEAMTAMVVAAFYHGKAFDGVLWSPNWQQTSHRHNFPTGFQFSVHRQSPVLASLFSPSEMFAVQMAFPLDSGAKSSLLSSGAKADDAHFIANQRAIADRLNAGIDNTLLSASSPANFSGIFATEQRTATGYEKKLFAVARFSSADVGAEVYEKIVAAKPADRDASLDYAQKLAEHDYVEDAQVVGMSVPHTTWHDLFVNDSSMLALRKRQTEMCGSVLLRTIHACGLGTVASSTSAPANLSALLESPALIKSVFNDVDHIASTNKLVYLSEMTSVNGASAGLVFRETPQLGVTLYKNVREPEAPKNAESPMIGLPVSVGQVHSMHTHARALKSLDKSELQLRSPFVWDTTAAGAQNIALSTSLYRQSKRNEWVAAATKFGLTDVSCEPMYLKPIVVKMATPDVVSGAKK